MTPGRNRDAMDRNPQKDHRWCVAGCRDPATVALQSVLAMNGLLWFYAAGMSYSGLRRSATPNEFRGAMGMFCISAFLFLLVFALRWESTWQVRLAVAYGLSLAALAILPSRTSTDGWSMEDLAALGVAVVTLIPACFRLMALRSPGRKPPSMLETRDS